MIRFVETHCQTALLGTNQISFYHHHYDSIKLAFAHCKIFVIFAQYLTNILIVQVKFARSVKAETYPFVSVFVLTLYCLHCKL